MENTDNIIEYNEEDYLTGQKMLKKKRIENCVLSHTTGSIEYRGLLLKKVSTAIINKKKTTYFRCRNMKTPFKLIGICNFSGRIINFPENLDLEIIHDHSPNCCYRGKFNFPIQNLKRKVPLIYKKKNNFILKPSLLPMIKDSENQVYDINDAFLKDSRNLPKLYIQLYNEVDKMKEKEVELEFKRLFSL